MHAAFFILDWLNDAVISIPDGKVLKSSRIHSKPIIQRPGSYFCEQLCFSYSIFHITSDEVRLDRPDHMFSVGPFALHPVWTIFGKYNKGASHVNSLPLFFSKMRVREIICTKFLRKFATGYDGWVSWVWFIDWIGGVWRRDIYQLHYFVINLGVWRYTFWILATVRKSMANVLNIWFSRNVLHVWEGGFRGLNRLIILETVLSWTSIPSFISSPCIRGAPQRGFALAISWMSLRISGAIKGLPARRFLDLNVQNSLKPFLCKRITVSGFTTIKTLFQSFQILDKNTQKIRSLILIFGRLTCCFIIASCWRSARFSMRRFFLIEIKKMNTKINKIIVSIML